MLRQYRGLRAHLSVLDVLAADSAGDVVSGHTPGPWEWYTNPIRGEKCLTNGPTMKFLVGSDGQGFAHTVGLQEPQDEANAQLMVAAPDLLAALKRLRDLDVDCAQEADRSAWATAHAAIAKAEGKS